MPKAKLPKRAARPTTSVPKADEPMATPMFTEFCVYTIVSRDKLDPIALDQAPLVNSEARTWKAAEAMLEEARAAGQLLPLLLADAKDCSRLLYWGILQSLKLIDKRTEYTIDYLRSLPGRHAPQELVLRTTGKHIAPGFIRPYAICFTPPFLTTGSAALALLPEEGPSEGTLTEGAAIQVTVNAFERNPAARRACVERYGYRCSVCGFDFAAAYGEIGEGFIHVHHLVPLGQIGGEYEVDPIRDLRPVCANCHAMIHRARPAMGIDQLRKKLRLHGASARNDCT